MRPEPLRNNEFVGAPVTISSVVPSTAAEDRRLQSLDGPAPRAGQRRSKPDAKAAEPNPDAVKVFLTRAILFLRRQWPLLLAGLLLGLALMPLALMIAPPSYKASATLMLDTSRIQIFAQPGVLGDTPLDSSVAVESQLEIMRSDRIARKTIKALNLDQHPMFQVSGEGRLAQLLGPTIAETLGRSPIRTPERIERFRIELLLSMLEIRRVSGTFAVEISASSDSPEEAARFANAVVQSYLSEHIEKKQELSTRAVGWLGGRIDELRDQLSEAQAAVSEFRKANNLAGVDLNRAYDARITELENQLGIAKAAANDNQTRMTRALEDIDEYAKAIVKPQLPDLAAQTSAASGLANSPMVTKLRESYMELSNREADWVKRFGNSHQAVVRLRQRMGEINAALLVEYRRLAESYRSEFDIASTRAKALETELAATLAEKEKTEASRLKLKELENVAANHQRMLESFLARQTETNEQRSFPIPRAWVLNEATPPLKKVFKRTIQAAIVLFGLGAAIGFGLALLREVADGSFRRLADARTIFPAAFPEIVPTATSATSTRPAAVAVSSDTTPRTIRHTAEVPWQVVEAPNASFARTVRGMRHHLADRLERDGVKVIGFLGANAGDGATTMATALSLAAASSGSRVLLVDCNLHDAGLTRSLAPAAQRGLIEVARRRAKLDDVIFSDLATGLDVMPLVQAPGVISDEFMASSDLADFINEAKTRYDIIAVDLPDLTIPIEPGLSRSFIQRYVGVVRWGRTNIVGLRDSVRSQGLDPGLFASLILNNAHFRRLSKYDPDAKRWLAR